MLRPIDSLWSEATSPPTTIPRRNSHTSSQGINCLPPPVTFSCLRGNDAGQNVWDRRSQWQVATDRPIVAVRTNDCCHVCNKHSSYHPLHSMQGLFRAVYSGCVHSGWIELRSVVYILLKKMNSKVYILSKDWVQGCLFIAASVVVFYLRLNMCHRIAMKWYVYFCWMCYSERSWNNFPGTNFSGKCEQGQRILNQVAELQKGSDFVLCKHLF